jgi:integrase/recombinase XerD
MSQKQRATPKVWPNVYPRFNSAGQITSWMVDCAGKDRLRFSFKTKAEADGKADLLRIQRKNEGQAAFLFSAADRIDAQAALDLLKPHGATLRQAASFYVRNIAVIQREKTVGEVLTELLAIKVKDESSKRYQKDLRLKLEMFAGDARFQNRSIHEITRDELITWLYSLDVAAVTRKNYARVLSVLFTFAVDRHYCVSHPARKLVSEKTNGKKPGILTTLEAKALLLSAEPDFVPALALGLFAGLRPESEIWRLNWQSIKLHKRIIDVDKSKNVMSHRHVRISDNLAAWLAPYADAHGGATIGPHGPVTVKGDSYYARLEKARAGAITRLENAGEFAGNLRDWPQDCLRHTFASMHCAAFRSPGDTSLELGHGGNLKIFERHYRDRVEEAEARAFWEIYPSEKIVPMPASLR